MSLQWRNLGNSLAVRANAFAEVSDLLVLIVASMVDMARSKVRRLGPDHAHPGGRR